MSQISRWRGGRRDAIGTAAQPRIAQATSAAMITIVTPAMR